MTQLPRLLIAALLAISWTANAHADDGGGADGGVPDAEASADAQPSGPDATVPEPAPPAVVTPPDSPAQMQEVTVVGTRERHTAGSAHILKEKVLERFDQDNPEAVLKSVPGVYTRGEDGIGLRPNLGLRGASPERSRKVTLMEDGILFGPAPYSAPAAYFFPLVTRMQGVRVIKGPGAIVFGPYTVGGAVDFITRRIPPVEGGGIDVAAGQYGYGKLHGHYGWNSSRNGFLVEGLHLRSDGFKQLDGGGDTGFERDEWMVKARHLLAEGHDLSFKGAYSSEDSRETYLGLSDEDYRDNPLRRYAASRFDRMRWHHTSLVLRHLWDFGAGHTLETTAYRHDFDRTWRKVNRFGDKSIERVLSDPTGVNAIYASILRGQENSTRAGEAIFIGPNARVFVSEGVQSVALLRFRGAVEQRVEAGVRLHYDRIDRHHSEDGFLMRGGNLIPDGRETIVNTDERVWSMALAAWIADAVTWKGLTFTPGLRTELMKSWARDRLTGQEIEGAFQYVLIPGLGAYAALTPSFGLLAGAYRGFSPAAAAQPGVQPETSWNYEAGARFTTGSVRLEAIGFFNDYHNLTSICSFSSGCDDANLDHQSDAGRAHIWGLEAFAQADLRLLPSLVVPLQAAYTFTRTELLEEFISDDPQLGHVLPGFELPYVPRHQLHGSLGVEWSRLGVFGEVSYVGATREVSGTGAVKSGPATDAALLVSASAHLWVWRSLSLYLQARNLGDSHAIASRRPFGARPVAPRWFQAGVKAAF
jgi:Fe(3+) dicitrate transport protein